jgi:hypothetical protein
VPSLGLSLAFVCGGVRAWGRRGGRTVFFPCEGSEMWGRRPCCYQESRVSSVCLSNHAPCLRAYSMLVLVGVWQVMGAVVDVEFDDMEGVPDILNALHVKVRGAVCNHAVCLALCSPTTTLPSCFAYVLLHVGCNVGVCRSAKGGGDGGSWPAIASTCVVFFSSPPPPPDVVIFWGGSRSLCRPPQLPRVCACAWVCVLPLRECA